MAGVNNLGNTIYDGMPLDRQMIMALMHSAPTFQSILPQNRILDILFKKGIGGLNDSSKWKDYTDKFAYDEVTDGSYDYYERVLMPEIKSKMLELPFSIFRKLQEALDRNKGKNIYDIMPLSDILDAIYEYMRGNAMAAVENVLWNGDKSVATGSTATGFENICDGLLKRFTADADVIDIVGAAVTKANVLDQMQVVFEGQPTTFTAGIPRYLYVSTNVDRAYRAAISGREIFAQNENISGAIYLESNLVLVPTFALPASNMVLTTQNNLFVGMQKANDLNRIQAVDDRINLNNVLKVRMDVTLDVNYAKGGEVVWYKTA